MKKLNVSSLVLGIISGIIVLCLGWALLVFVTVITGLTRGEFLANLYMSFCLVYMLGGLLSIVAGTMCFKKPFLARILLLVSCFLTLILPIGIICLNQSFNASNLFIFIPSVLTLIAGILGLKKSKTTNKINGDINHE